MKRWFLLLCVFLTLPCSSLPRLGLRRSGLEQALWDRFQDSSSWRLPPANLRFSLPAPLGTGSMKTGPLHLKSKPHRDGFRLELPKGSQNEGAYEVSACLSGLEISVEKIDFLLPDSASDPGAEISIEGARFAIAEGAGCGLGLKVRFSLVPADPGVRIEILELDVQIPPDLASNLSLGFSRLTAEGRTIALPRLGEEGIRALLTALAPRAIAGLVQRSESKLETALLRKLEAVIPREALRAVMDLSRWSPGLSLEIYPRNITMGPDDSILAELLPGSRIGGKLTLLNGNSGPGEVVDPLPALPHPDDLGLLIPESDLRGLLELPGIQSGLEHQFERIIQVPGVRLLPSGVFPRIRPESNSASLILPLEIDMARTLQSGDPWAFRLRTLLGDWIETWFGSGPSVKIPLEFPLIPRVEEGRIHVTLASPFGEDGVYVSPEGCPPQLCPSNVERMSRRVRRDFLRTLNQRLRERLPESGSIPAGPVRNIGTAPRNSLWITARSS